MKKLSAILAVLALTSCLTPTGQQSPAEVITYKQGGGAGTTGMHTVLTGDTVYTVSQDYNLPLREIISINNHLPVKRWTNHQLAFVVAGKPDKCPAILGQHILA